MTKEADAIFLLWCLLILAIGLFMASMTLGIYASSTSARIKIFCNNYYYYVDAKIDPKNQYAEEFCDQVGWPRFKPTTGKLQ